MLLCLFTAIANIHHLLPLLMYIILLFVGWGPGPAQAMKKENILGYPPVERPIFPKVPL